LWTVDPGDWRPGVQSDDVEAATSTINGDDVVILHDAIQKRRLLAATIVLPL
jgi:hypothetical protein